MFPQNCVTFASDSHHECSSLFVPPNQHILPADFKGKFYYIFDQENEIFYLQNINAAVVTMNTRNGSYSLSSQPISLHKSQFPIQILLPGEPELTVLYSEIFGLMKKTSSKTLESYLGKNLQIEITRKISTSYTQIESRFNSLSKTVESFQGLLSTSHQFQSIVYSLGTVGSLLFICFVICLISSCCCPVTFSEGVNTCTKGLAWLFSCNHCCGRCRRSGYELPGGQNH